MSNRKFQPPLESKLSKTLSHSQKEIETEKDKAGFINQPNKTTSFKTKSFRLRESDFQNLQKISNAVNNSNERRNFSDSQIIRGLINYISTEVSIHEKNLLVHVNASS